MGLEMPGWITEPLGWIGMTWPEADETLLFEAGQTWIKFGTNLQSVRQRAGDAAQQVMSENQGETIDAFKRWWAEHDGPDARLVEDSIAAVIIGEVLILFAAVTLALKIAFIVQLAILVAQVAAALAAAIATFGSSTATIPEFIAIAKQACQKLVDKVIERVQTFFKQLLERAKNLLKKVEAKAAERAARRLERGLARDLRRVNPHFDPADTAFSANCTHCVQAFELRRRGIDVEATALPQRFHPFQGRPLGDVENAWGRRFSPVNGRADIEQAFQNFGPGSRGVVYTQWQGGRGAHVFNVENANGAIRFMDGQNGLADASQYFSRGQNFHFLRLDDLPTPPNLTEFTTPR
jgi:papain fold toxin 1 (glutamine deamidase) of polymorphic toxin system